MQSLRPFHAHHFLTSDQQVLNIFTLPFYATIIVNRETRRQLLVTMQKELSWRQSRTTLLIPNAAVGSYQVRECLHV